MISDSIHVVPVFCAVLGCSCVWQAAYGSSQKSAENEWLQSLLNRFVPEKYVKDGHPNPMLTSLANAPVDFAEKAIKTVLARVKNTLKFE